MCRSEGVWVGSYLGLTEGDWGILLRIKYMCRSEGVWVGSNLG